MVKVLVVDDVPSYALLMATLLSEQGHEVRTALGGAEALALVQSEPPDIILLDVSMPGMDGIEVCRRLRTDPGLRSIPVILVTANSRNEDVITGLDAGADDYLVKPVTRDVLAARVRSALRMKQMYDTVAEMNEQLRKEIADREEVEKTLRDSDLRFRQLAENIKEVFWIYDVDRGAMVYISPSYEEVSGRSREELYRNPRSFLEQIHPEDLDAMLAALTRHRRAFRLEYRVLRPDGTIRWIWDLGYPVKDASGRVHRVVGIAQDITDRKRSEEHLVRHNALLQAINQVFEKALECQTDEEVALACLAVARDLTHSSAGYVGEINARGQYHHVAMCLPDSPVPCQGSCGGLAGLDNQSVHRLRDTVLGEGKVVLENDFRRQMAVAEIPAWHLPLTSFLGVPLKHGGVVVGMLALANKDGGYDASDQEAMETLATAFVAALLRTRAETAQRETKDLLHATLESTTDGIIVTDEAGTITQCNARFAQMFRFPVDFAQSWEKERIFQHILDQVADPAAFREEAENLKPTREILRSTLVLKDGRVYERVSSPLVRNGANAGSVHSLRDVTERVRAEARLRQKEEELRQSQKMEMVGQLAGGIAHEFNNLLQAIEGYTNYALDGLPPDQQRHQDLQQVLKASGRAAALTRQLLGFSRHRVLERKNIDPNQVVNDLLAMLRPLIGAHIQVKTVLAEDAGVILADTGELEEALLNLCVNARDAMPSGGELVLKTATRRLENEEIRHLRSQVKPGRYAVLTVADNGCGMAPETKQRIFEPFYTTKEVGKGTGLGLANVYGIVQQHGGTIEVESELGRGSTFEIYLPTVPERSDDEHGAAALPAAGGSEPLPAAKDGGLAWTTT